MCKLVNNRLFSVRRGSQPIVTQQVFFYLVLEAFHSLSERWQQAEFGQKRWKRPENSSQQMSQKCWHYKQTICSTWLLMVSEDWTEFQTSNLPSKCFTYWAISLGLHIFVLRCRVQIKRTDQLDNNNRPGVQAFFGKGLQRANILILAYEFKLWTWC